MHQPNAAVCRLSTVGLNWNRLSMFHRYFENPSKYSYLILILKVPLFSPILPCKTYQLYTKFCQAWHRKRRCQLAPPQPPQYLTLNTFTLCLQEHPEATQKMLWNATGTAEKNKNGSSLYPFLCLGGCLLILLRCHLVDLCILKQRIEWSALKIKGISDLILSQSHLL